MNASGLANARPRPRLRFSLLGLLVFTTIAALALAWLFRPKPAQVVSLLQVSSTGPQILAGGPPQSVDDFADYCQAQQEFILSDGVLRAAVADPQVASLSAIKSQSDPVAWLKIRLKIDFPNDSEIMRVTLTVPNAGAEQGRKIVDTLVATYLAEWSRAEQRRRQQFAQTKREEHDQLRQQIADKSRQIADLRDKLGQDDPVARMMQDQVDELRQRDGQIEGQLSAGYPSSGPSRVRLIQPAVVVPGR